MQKDIFQRNFFVVIVVVVVRLNQFAKESRCKFDLIYIFLITLLNIEHWENVKYLKLNTNCKEMSYLLRLEIWCCCFLLGFDSLVYDVPCKATHQLNKRLWILILWNFFLLIFLKDFKITVTHTFPSLFCNLKHQFFKFTVLYFCFS